MGLYMGIQPLSGALQALGWKWLMMHSYTYKVMHAHTITPVSTQGKCLYTYTCALTDTLMHSVVCTRMHACASHTHTDTRRWCAENKAFKSRERSWISDLMPGASSYLEMEAPEDILLIYSLLLGSGTLIRAELRSFFVNLCGKDIHAYLEVILSSCGRNACGDIKG